jgi:hypothetical protein
MTKLQKLVESGVLDDAHLSDEQRRIIEDEISDHELETLVRLGNKLRVASPFIQKKVGCAF